MWTFCKQVRSKQMLLKPGEPILDTGKLYKVVRRGWLGYLSLLNIDLQQLMSCPEEECSEIQGDGLVNFKECAFSVAVLYYLLR